MEIFEADLRAFTDDWMLFDQAEQTVIGYINKLRQYESWCSEQGLQTTTMRGRRGADNATSA